jgi:hypothetical protein
MGTLALPNRKRRKTGECEEYKLMQLAPKLLLDQLQGAWSLQRQKLKIRRKPPSSRSELLLASPRGSFEFVQPIPFIGQYTMVTRAGC